MPPQPPCSAHLTARQMSRGVNHNDYGESKGEGCMGESEVSVVMICPATGGAVLWSGDPPASGHGQQRCWSGSPVMTPQLGFVSTLFAISTTSSVVLLLARGVLGRVKPLQPVATRSPGWECASQAGPPPGRCAHWARKYPHPAGYCRAANVVAVPVPAARRGPLFRETELSEAAVLLPTGSAGLLAVDCFLTHPSRAEQGWQWAGLPEARPASEVGCQRAGLSGRLPVTKVVGPRRPITRAARGLPVSRQPPLTYEYEQTRGCGKGQGKGK